MQCRDEFVDCLAFLSALIELCSLENNITANHEVFNKLYFVIVVLLRLCSNRGDRVNNRNV